LMGAALLNTEQAAARVGLKPRTLERYRRMGCGPTYVKLGVNSVNSPVRYRPEDLDQWLDAGRRRSTSDPSR
jgi:hypothetical protein